MSTDIRRVAILFAGGPAPAANAVICSAARAFLKSGREVIGLKHGYGSFENYEDGKTVLEEGKDYIRLDWDVISESRNKRGILIGTARTNPGKLIKHVDDLKDDTKTAPLKRVYDGLRSLGVDALISIGGDDTLKTANKFFSFQDYLPEGSHRIKVVHLPKTIDNDYKGIDFTFGFFTAVDWMAKEVLNLLADAKASRAYYIVECMGRKAGWLSYGVSIAGEANLVVAVEDIDDMMKEAGKDLGNGVLDLDVLVDKIANLIINRRKHGKEYGVVVLAEGLAERLPPQFLENTTLDEHGHISLGDVQLDRLVTRKVKARLEALTGEKRKITPVQLGYESRCAEPHAFDVMLGSALGTGAYRALVEDKVDGHMVSTEGQLEVLYVPFSKLVDPETLITDVRFIEPGSDFQRLARMMES